MTIRIHRFLILIALLFALRIQAADYLPRTWTNNLGVKREAAFVKETGGEVTLLLKNGQMVTMPLDKLSPADQEYIRGLQAAAAAIPAPVAASSTGSSAPPTDSQPDTVQPTPAPARRQSLLLRPVLFHAPDPRVRPKAEIEVTFPDLGKSRTNEPMGMQIRIPASYSPDRPVPLLVWMAGGDGSSNFRNALPLVNPDDFVVVGINYPGGDVPEPRIAARSGDIAQVWDYEEKMLAKLQDMIPNIDPRLRVIAGFSNGAHIIGGCLARQLDGMYGYFNVYVLIEGGISDKYDYPSLPGRYCYISWGDGPEGRGDEFGAMLTNYAKKAGMKVESHPMHGIGHDFPDAEKAKVKAWLENVVLPAQLAKP